MKHYLLLAIAATFVVSGCAKESERPKATGEGTVRAINAISTSPDFGFLIEERFLEPLKYKTASSESTWDNLSYTFNFDVLLAGDVARTRVASVLIDVENDRDYTMLLSGAIDAPDVTLWENEIREWQSDETAFELRIANASPTLGPVDVYFDAPGTAPVLGNALGTVDFGEILPAQEYEPTERTLILTAANDPGTVLYESVPLTLAERTSYILAPFDPDANDVGPIPVLLINATRGGGGSIADVNTQSTARFFHASQAMGNADIFIDDPLTVPVVANQAFGEFTGDLPVTSGDVPVTYTAPGNVGSILIDSDRVFTVNAHHSLFAVRNSVGEDLVSNFVIDRRSVETQTKLTIINTTTNHPIVDVYVVPTGESIDETFPVIPRLTALAPPFTTPLLPEQYDLYLTVPNEKTVLLGPIALDAQPGSVIEALIYDTVDPNVPSLAVIPPP
ncbi:MAG: DUF4397 domain-containing protein [Woeseiaceae bacterium]|nr:DUF4397 domain-containing protein [Woeseiaceae bacterium]NIP19802.1 DUF4397 domain-containing protein [Woeseiaceae bacterium]NIS89919.1 DUF4397 domain-containing protein [Woeseiaceae bacterium]